MANGNGQTHYDVLGVSPDATSAPKKNSSMLDLLSLSLVSNQFRLVYEWVRWAKKVGVVLMKDVKMVKGSSSSLSGFMHSAGSVLSYAGWIGLAPLLLHDIFQVTKAPFSQSSRKKVEKNG